MKAGPRRIGLDLLRKGNRADMHRWLTGLCGVLLVVIGVLSPAVPLEADDLVRAGDRVISEADLEDGLYEDLYRAEPFFEGATQPARVRGMAVPDTFYVLGEGRVVSAEEYRRREQVRQVHEMIPFLYVRSAIGDVTDREAREYLEDAEELFRRATGMVERNWSAMWTRRRMYERILQLRDEGRDPAAWFREEGHRYRRFRREWKLMNRHASRDQLEYRLAELPRNAEEYEEIVLDTSIQHYAQDRWVEDELREHFKNRGEPTLAEGNMLSREVLDWLIEEGWLEVLDEDFGRRLKERADRQPSGRSGPQLQAEQE